MPDLLFAAWAQTPIGASIKAGDDGQDLGPAQFQPGVVVASSAGGAPIDGRAPELTMLGPGGVVGFDAGLVVRVEPAAGAGDVEDNYLAAIEFSAPELPWLLTPARPGSRNRLRPWIVLVVVDAATPLVPGRPLPTIDVSVDELQDLSDSWGWAHVQLPSPDATPPPGLENLAAQRVSRLVCPRRLGPNTRYRACVVPAFEGGRAAGLGLTGAATTSHAPAWFVERGGRVKLPVYHHWEFGTGQSGDFEQLVRRLEPVDDATLSSVGVTFVDISRPWDHDDPLSDGVETVAVRGVLETFADVVEGTATGETRKAFVDRLVAHTSAAADRLAGAHDADDAADAVTPPVYGGRHAGADRLFDPVELPLQEVDWWLWLNLDPANRIAAALGTEYVRANQELLIAQAWEQVGAIREANRQRAMAELATEVASSVHRRHISQLEPGELLAVTAPAADRVRSGPRGGPSLAGEVHVSRLPDAVASSSFARLVRPAGPVARVSGVRFGTVATRALSGETSVPDPPRVVFAPEAPAPTAEPTTDLQSATAAAVNATVADTTSTVLVDLFVTATVAGMNGFGDAAAQLDATVANAVATAGADMFAVQTADVATLRSAVGTRLGEVTAALAGGIGPVTSAGTGVSELGVTVDASNLQQRLVDALRPGEALAARLATRVHVPDELAPPAWFGPVMAHPTFPVPTALALLATNPEWFLPGVGAFPANRAALLRVNAPFVESYLVGMNHEMMQELRWREYPTDLRGTPFRRFWPRPFGDDDIAPIDTWSDVLGSHLTLRPEALAVLLLRGDVVRRFPGMIVRAVEAHRDLWPPTPTESPGPDAVRDPLFTMPIDAHTAVYAFELDPAVLQTAPVEGAPGWFIVLQEHSHRIRFGFDVSEDDTDYKRWYDLAWPPAAVPTVPDPPSRGFAFAGADVSRPDEEPAAGASWNTDAADVARIALQRPFRVAIHAHRLVGR